MSLLVVVAAQGCSHAPKPKATVPSATSSATAKAFTVLEARISPTQGNECQGLVIFTDEGGGTVKVNADLQGLPPLSKHGIHIHETGDCSAPDGMSAGAHYNPTKQPHGLPPAENRHVGDLGNVSSDAAGNAHYEVTLTNLSMSASGNSILGRAVIVHALVDDGGQPTGNAGARVGCGVISAPNSTPRN